MKSRKLVGGAIVLLLLTIMFQSSCTDGAGISSDDDWPPIIVKSGSIDFGTKLVWKKDVFGKQWKQEKPKDKGFKDVQEFLVTVTVPAGSTCGEMRGTEVLVDFLDDSGAPLHFTIDRSGSKTHVPKVHSPVGLVERNVGSDSDNTLTYSAQGYISQLEVKGGTKYEPCKFTANPVEIQVCSNTCPPPPPPKAK